MKADNNITIILDDLQANLVAFSRCHSQWFAPIAIKTNIILRRRKEERRQFILRGPLAYVWNNFATIDCREPNQRINKQNKNFLTL